MTELEIKRLKKKYVAEDYTVLLERLDWVILHKVNGLEVNMVELLANKEQPIESIISMEDFLIVLERLTQD